MMMVDTISLADLFAEQAEIASDLLQSFCINHRRHKGIVFPLLPLMKPFSISQRINTKPIQRIYCGFDRRLWQKRPSRERYRLREEWMSFRPIRLNHLLRLSISRG